MQFLRFVGYALRRNTSNIFLKRLESRSLQNSRLYYREIRSYARRIRSIRLEEAPKYGRRMLAFNTFARLVEDSMLSSKRRAFATPELWTLSHRERPSDGASFTRGNHGGILGPLNKIHGDISRSV